ncbi:MAG TPA: alpha/beta hydrolase [Gammaproteobacteria bacterium]|nr:alpha/beta hydrolase [Gammaproteobacteria bacterium]
MSFFKTYLLHIIFCILSSVILTNAFAKSYHTANNKIISYTDVGTGKPIVLIHAFATDLRLWDPQQKPLQKNFRVISVDLWGFGQSSLVDGNAISMTEYADEVKDLLDNLKISQAVIGGESMGGYIALAFLQKYPEKVAGLILSDTQSTADNEDAKTKRETLAQNILKNGKENFVNSFLPKLLSPNASEDKKLFIKNIVESEAATSIASALRGMGLRVDTSDVLAHSTSPILIITGDQDAAINPEQSRRMHSLAKNSQFIIIKNAGHLSNLEQPDKWNEAVVNMFYQIGSS